jgi:hypothetical protein
MTKCIECKHDLTFDVEPGYTICPNCGLSQYINEAGGQGRNPGQQRDKYTIFDGSGAVEEHPRTVNG